FRSMASKKLRRVILLWSSSVVMGSSPAREAVLMANHHTGRLRDAYRVHLVNLVGHDTHVVGIYSKKSKSRSGRRTSTHPFCLDRAALRQMGYLRDQCR